MHGTFQFRVLGVRIIRHFAPMAAANVARPATIVIAGETGIRAWGSRRP